MYVLPKNKRSKTENNPNFSIFQTTTRNYHMRLATITPSLSSTLSGWDREWKQLPAHGKHARADGSKVL